LFVNRKFVAGVNGNPDHPPPPTTKNHNNNPSTQKKNKKKLLIHNFICCFFLFFLFCFLWGWVERGDYRSHQQRTYDSQTTSHFTIYGKK